MGNIFRLTPTARQHEKFQARKVSQFGLRQRQSSNLRLYCKIFSFHAIISFCVDHSIGPHCVEYLHTRFACTALGVNGEILLLNTKQYLPPFGSTTFRVSCVTAPVL